MELHKTILTIMASAMILGLGTNIPQSSVSAHHVRTYRARRQNVRKNHKTLRRSVNKIRTKRHYTKKHVKRNAKQRMNKRAENTKATKKTRKSRNHKTRMNRKGISRRLKKRGKRTYRHRNHKYIKNPYAKFSHAQLAKWASMGGDPDTSVKDFINWNKKTYPANGQPVKAYNLNNQVLLLSKYQLNKLAHQNGMSASAFIKKYNPKNYTWANNYGEGIMSKAEQKAAIKDAVAILNQRRAKQGAGPLTINPILQFIAEKRSDLMAQHKENFSHWDPNMNDYTGIICNQYHIPDISLNENIHSGNIAYNPGTSAHTIGEEENNDWDANHIATRMSPYFNEIGMGISRHTDIVTEEFGNTVDN